MKSNNPSAFYIFHAVAVIIALILLPLPSKPANIGILLMALTLLRLPTTVETLLAIFQKPIVLLLLSWCLLAYLSTLWSVNPNRSLLASPLLLVIIPSLYPLREKSDYLVLSFGLGVAIHIVIQVFMWQGVIQGHYEPGTVSGGLHWYTPFTALWSSVSMFLLLGLLFSTNSKRITILSAILLIPTPLSLLISGNKTIFFVIPFATSILAIKLFTLTTSNRKRCISVITCLFIVIIDVGLLIIPGMNVNKRSIGLVKQTMRATDFGIQTIPNEELTTSIELRKKRVDRFSSTFGLRYVWWRAGYVIWRENPWIGHGSGSSLNQFAWSESQIPTDLGADIEGFITPEPHSSILATTIEQGLLGIVLMASCILLALRYSWRYAFSNTLLVGLPAAWVMAIVIGFVHTIQFSAYASSCIILLLAMTLFLYKKVEKPPNTSENTPITLEK